MRTTEILGWFLLGCIDRTIEDALHACMCRPCMGMHFCGANELVDARNYAARWLHHHGTGTPE